MTLFDEYIGKVGKTRCAKAMYGTALIDELGSFCQMIAGAYAVPTEIPEDMPKVYVVTNLSSQDGAAQIFDKEVQHDLWEKLGGNYFIIPSSVHEVMVVSETYDEDGGGIKYLTDTIQMVNRTNVLPEDRLSNRLYKYDRDLDEIVVA